MPKAAAVARVLVIALLLFTGAGRQSHAQNAVGGDTPVDQFAKEYKKLKDSLAGLPKEIDESGKKIQTNTNPVSAKTQLYELRRIVSTVLAQVADNGPVSKMGDAAVNFANSKLKEMESDTHFTQEQRNFLITQWKAAAETTTNAVKDLNAARKELAGLLRVLQSNEDFLQELENLNNAAQTVTVLQNLTRDMQEISNHLKNIINRMSVPSM